MSKSRIRKIEKLSKGLDPVTIKLSIDWGPDDPDAEATLDTDGQYRSEHTRRLLREAAERKARGE